MEGGKKKPSPAYTENPKDFTTRSGVRTVFRNKRVVTKHLELLFQRDLPQHQDTKEMPTQQDWQMSSSAVQVDPT